MTHTLGVRGVVRWTQFSEHEGVVQGELDGLPVTCYFLAAAAQQWDIYRLGATLEVDAWLERSGDVETLPGGSQAALTQVNGSVYDVSGVVRQQDGEQLQVDSTIPIRIDLDMPYRRQPPQLRIGDVIRVRGVLKIELLSDGPA